MECSKHPCPVGSFILRVCIPVMFAAIGFLLLTSCTEYERNGVNSRPFNEPTDWEQNPYGNAFRN